MRYKIKNKQTIDVQENDHWELSMYIDDHFPFMSSEFTFAVYNQKKQALITKPNLPKSVETVLTVSRNKIVVTGVPSDTIGRAGMDLIFELQIKTSDNKFYTIGQGDFNIHRTYITNV